MNRTLPTLGRPISRVNKTNIKMEIYCKTWRPSSSSLGNLPPNQSYVVGKTTHSISRYGPSIHYVLHATLGTTDNPGGIGAVLTQNFDGVTKPIGYFSRRLRNHELRYTIFNVEMCSVVYALKHWEPLLKGAKLVGFTDYLPLQKHSTREGKTMTQLLQKILLFDCVNSHILWGLITE